MTGENLDLSSSPDPPPRPAAGGADQRFIGVHFVCCDVYSRIYINRSGSAYDGHCPRCGKKITFKIGPGGVDARFFTVG